MAFQLAGTDMHGSPLLSLQSNTVTMFSWGPYGGCTPVPARPAVYPVLTASGRIR
ncbi:Uncharacterised protein [Salmonella enterica subsp. arizonae]|nr:Uncharacterised protein [Salmonella enterica subsp. arizonae]